MKKYTLMFAISILTLTTFAQSTQKNKIKYYHEAGITSSFELEGRNVWDMMPRQEMIALNNFYCFGLYELHGIEFNPHLILSVEFDVNYIFAKADTKYRGGPGEVVYCDAFGFNFMFGLDFKYLVLKNRKWTPFLEMSYCPPICFAVYSTKGYPKDYDYNTKGEIVRLDRFARLSFYAGCSYKVKDRQSLNMSVGYMIPGNSLLLRVGYRFR